jgi:hypothetical protein
MRSTTIGLTRAEFCLTSSCIILAALCPNIKSRATLWNSRTRYSSSACCITSNNTLPKLLHVTCTIDFVDSHRQIIYYHTSYALQLLLELRNSPLCCRDNILFECFEFISFSEPFPPARLFQTSHLSISYS